MCWYTTWEHLKYLVFQRFISLLTESQAAFRSISIMTTHLYPIFTFQLILLFCPLWLKVELGRKKRMLWLILILKGTGKKNNFRWCLHCKNSNFHWKLNTRISLFLCKSKLRYLWNVNPGNWTCVNRKKKIFSVHKETFEGICPFFWMYLLTNVMPLALSLKSS